MKVTLERFQIFFNSFENENLKLILQKVRKVTGKFKKKLEILPDINSMSGSTESMIKVRSVTGRKFFEI